MEAGFSEGGLELLGGAGSRGVGMEWGDLFRDAGRWLGIPSCRWSRGIGQRELCRRPRMESQFWGLGEHWMDGGLEG